MGVVARYVLSDVTNDFSGMDTYWSTGAVIASRMLSAQAVASSGSALLGAVRLIFHSQKFTFTFSRVAFEEVLASAIPSPDPIHNDYNHSCP